MTLGVSYAQLGSQSECSQRWVGGCWFVAFELMGGAIDSGSWLRVIHKVMEVGKIGHVGYFIREKWPVGIGHKTVSCIVKHRAAIYPVQGVIGVAWTGGAFIRV